jgi:invasion protein IalB
MTPSSPDRPARLPALAGAALLAGLLASAAAQEPAMPPVATPPGASPLGVHEDWFAYEATEQGRKFCFMVSRPTRVEPAGLNHGEVILYVTHRPAENASDVVSLLTGYGFQRNSDVRVRIGSRDFALFTNDNTAWARDVATDRALVEAMKGGASLTARATSQRGNNTSYTFSLLGFTAAHDQISQACGVAN